MAPKSTVNMAFFICDDMLATGTSLPMEMLQAANSAAALHLPAAPKLNIKTVACNNHKIHTRAGFQLLPDQTLKQTGQLDQIFLPALWRNPRIVLKREKPVIQWLKDQFAGGAALSSVGTGACFLAETGLLDHLPATTHWHYFDQFEKNYPSIELKRQYFITQAERLYTAASVNSLADLTIYFIRQLFGKSIATHVERHFSHEIRRSMEDTGYFMAQPHGHPDEQIVQIQDWINSNYFKSVTVSSIAEKFGMSVRTLNRRFKAALKQSPIQYLQAVRTNTAKELLQTSNFTISEVAYKVGYQDAAHFTHLFKKTIGITPTQYRVTVRAKLFSTD